MKPEHAPTGWTDLSFERQPLTRKARHLNERIRQQYGTNAHEKVYGSDLELVLLRHGEHCFYCGVEVDFYDDPPSGTFDHVQALTQGGRNVWQNLVPCCHPCNGKKGERKLVYRNGRTVWLWPDQK